MGKKKQSIVQDLNDYRCFNPKCRREYGLEIHHVWFGTANRKHSDEDGLIVWLCRDCHRGSHGVHGGNKALDDQLKRLAEIAWIANGNGDIEDFIHRYGKNLLEINI